MLTRLHGSTRLATQALQQWRHVPQAPSMSTMRTPIARMLLSTNQSRIVDISHENELKRGLKTSGEKSTYEEDRKTLSDRAQQGANSMAEGMQDTLNKASDTANDAAERAASKMRAMSENATDGMRDMANKGNEKLDSAKETAGRSTSRGMEKLNDLSGRTSQRMQDIQNQGKEKTSSTIDDMADRAAKQMKQMPESVQADMKKAGQQPDDMIIEDSTKRMHGVSYNSSPETLERGQEMKDPARESQEQSEMDPLKMADQAQSGKKFKSDETDFDRKHVQPGTKHLRGTEDNFDNDPAISIGDMEDKIRETKDKITGGADHVLGSVKQSVMQTGQGIAETAKGMKDAAKSSVLGAATKAKEFVTGEKEDEKPDETKSEVRTKDGTFPPGTKVGAKKDRSKSASPLGPQ